MWKPQYNNFGTATKSIVASIYTSILKLFDTSYIIKAIPQGKS